MILKSRAKAQTLAPIVQKTTQQVASNQQVAPRVVCQALPYKTFIPTIHTPITLKRVIH